MSKFTPGPWCCQEYVPEGVTLNGREYLISSEEEKNDVALARTEADAKFIAAAPEMYELLSVWVQIQPGAHFTMTNAQDTARELLARIDGEGANP